LVVGEKENMSNNVKKIKNNLKNKFFNLKFANIISKIPSSIIQLYYLVIRQFDKFIKIFYPTMTC